MSVVETEFYKTNSAIDSWEFDVDDDYLCIARVREVDAEGNVAAHYAYSAFGRQLLAEDDIGFTNRFSAKPYCAKTGFVEYEFREYAPNSGRWFKHVIVDGIPYWFNRFILGKKKAEQIDHATHPPNQMNQADFFYVSGHGVHRFGEIDGHEPQSVSGRWNKDLNCIIFAGCSVLDVNDFNNNYAYSAVEHAASPGKLWEAAGPGILLGYNYIATGDAGGAPARIIRSWVDNRAYAGDVGAWMQANADNRAWNACAIVKGQKYVHFTRKWFSHTIEEKPKGDW